MANNKTKTYTLSKKKITEMIQMNVISRENASKLFPDLFIDKEIVGIIAKNSCSTDAGTISFSEYPNSKICVARGVAPTYALKNKSFFLGGDWEIYITKNNVVEKVDIKSGNIFLKPINK